MKKRWDEHVYGHVTATVTGRLAEMFINKCVSEEIAIWNITRLDDRRIRCTLLLKDIKSVKRILKATDCRIHFEDRLGFPFVLRRIMGRLGVVGGIFLFLVVLTILSNMIWKINITGADGKVEDQIRKALTEMNVHVGALTWFTPPLEKVENSLSAGLTKVTWVGVSKDGTTFRIDVVQKELPKKEKETGPRDLVSKKEATILDIYVQSGTAKVEPNDFVNPGQVLISGMIGDEKNPKFVGAKGKVIAETWYEATIDVPLKNTYETYTGDSYTTHRIAFFGWSFPVWGFDEEPFKSYNKETFTKTVRFMFWDLPINYIKNVYRETDKDKRKRNEKQAVEIGLEVAKHDLLEKLSKNASILSHEIMASKVKDGVLHLSIYFTVKEEISKPRTFMPQERKQKIEDKQKKKKETNQ